MTDGERNDLDLLTEAELASALALLAPSDNARAMVAAVAAIPPAERGHYRWAYEVVVAAAALSEEVAARIRRHYGETPEAQERIASEQRLFQCWRAAGGAIKVAFRLEEVVIDTRNPVVGLDRAYTSPSAEPITRPLISGVVRVNS